MKITLFYTLIILGVISIGTAYAEGSLISVQTDDNNYSEKDTIIISGEIATIIGDTQVTMQLFQGANLIEIAQIKVSQDGNYSHRINAEGPLWTNQGTYMVKVTYGEANVAETLFEYTPESEIIETTKEFEVDAGDTGTFDIKYTISGGTVEDIEVESENFGLLVKLLLDTDTGTSIISSIILAKEELQNKKRIRINFKNTNHSIILKVVCQLSAIKK